MSLTERAARALAGVAFSGSEPVLQIAKAGLADYLAVSFMAAGEAGAESGVSRLLEYARAAFAPGPCPLLGAGAGLAAEGSALYNGFLGHYLDYDDVSQELRGHLSTVLWPALLALAAHAGGRVGGSRLLGAYCVGAELALRLGRCLKDTLYLRGFHNTALLGVLGAAAAGGYLLALEPQALARALGFAVSQAGGARLQFGTEGKPLQAGMAAQKAVQAVLLAQAGLTGSSDPLSGRLGFAALYGADAAAQEQAEALLASPWGESWELERSGLWFKRFPFCAAASHTADAVLQLRQEESFSPGEIEEVRLIFPPQGDAALVCRRPRTGEEGRFSAEYVAALGLLGLPYTLEHFRPQPLNRAVAGLLPLVRRVCRGDIAPSPEAQPKGRFTIAEIVLRGGRILRRRSDAPAGSPRSPLSAEERAAKLYQALAEPQAKELLAALEQLERRPQTRELLLLLARLEPARTAARSVGNK